MITVLGSTGFIGSSLVRFLREAGVRHSAPPRDFVPDKGSSLGHVIYCIGLTADFRQKPMETVEAHVCKVVEILEHTRFDSFLYLSSTRVYNRASTGVETADLRVNPNDFSDLYNLSKLMGESVCLAIPDRHVRIARLSNVIGHDLGSDNFIFSLIREAVDKKRIVLRQPLDQAKDYIGIDDVLRLILAVAREGRERIYNFASGLAITNQEIVNKISAITGCAVEAVEDQTGLDFPAISIQRITDEFTFKPAHVLDSLEEIIHHYEQNKHDTH